MQAPCHFARLPNRRPRYPLGVALRLVLAVLPDERPPESLLDGLEPSRSLALPAGPGRLRLEVVLPAGQVEALTDRLTARFAGSEGFQVAVLPVEAAIPPLEEPPPPPAEVVPEETAAPSGKARISREELYEDVAGELGTGPAYLAAVALSALVAAVGLLRGDVAVLVGAMVIAPLLRPNVALALASALGDLDLGLRALRVGAVGAAVALGLSLVAGALLPVDPASPQLAARAALGPGDLVLALAAGAAGALAFTSGLPSALIGVMVAVALLPPLVAAGLLLGSGHLAEAGRALVLALTNVSCLNLAGVATFRLRGIRPRTWWEGERARRAARRALLFWAAALAALAVAVVLSWRTTGTLPL